MGDRTREGSSFGDRLKELRERAGLSQAQLADRAGMNVFGVAKLEQGQREPSWATVLALATALGVDCTAFAGGGNVEDVKGEEPDPAAKPVKQNSRKRGK
jgi:transcriptional regulator with XRE-family HTH domain